MAMSGVKLTNECQNTYQAIQKDKKFRYAIFKIADGEICLDKVRKTTKCALRGTRFPPEISFFLCVWHRMGSPLHFCGGKIGDFPRALH